jgi:outer membrane protein TolC
VALNVQQAWYTALQHQRLVGVGERILTDRQLIVRQAAAFYRAEIKSKVDLTLAEVGASNANLELVEARDRLRTAFAELNYAMGIEGEPEYRLEEPMITIAAAPALAPLVAEGQQERHELLAFDAQIKADQEFVIRAEKDKWPKLLFLFSGGWVRFADPSPGKLLLGAFGVDLPLFDGGRIEAQIAESKARLAETRAARDELAQNIRFQTERAYNELLSSIESVRAHERLITQAREALRLANVRYRVQVGSFVELTSAEAAASSAEAQYAQALYKYKMAEASLNYVVGRAYKP